MQSWKLLIHTSHGCAVSVTFIRGLDSRTDRHKVCGDDGELTDRAGIERGVHMLTSVGAAERTETTLGIEKHTFIASRSAVTHDDAGAEHDVDKDASVTENPESSA